MISLVTESPIEERFAEAMARAFEAERSVELRDVDFEVRSQVCIERYRVDFLLSVELEAGQLGVHQPVGAHIVVECDGHEWHERTKEQAARDRARDRALLILGYPVIRFTGAEIHRDASRCVRDSFAALGALARWQAFGQDGEQSFPQAA